MKFSGAPGPVPRKRGREAMTLKFEGAKKREIFPKNASAGGSLRGLAQPYKRLSPETGLAGR